MGSRLLRHWLHHPPPRRRSRAGAAAAIGALLDAPRGPRASTFARALRQISDIERITGRSRCCRRVRAISRACAIPSLRCPRCATAGAVKRNAATAPRWRVSTPRSNRRAECLDLLKRAIAPEPAALVRDGGVIARGFDAELDELRDISENCDQFLIDLETRERARTGIANLRVEYNKVHGFYIEVTRGQTDKVPDDYRAARR
jgi:DNA mismatch repair protein MutS